MSADWIKMRTDLYRDPKVCIMADELMDPKGELARYVDQNTQRAMSVTRNVMRNVTVGALVSVWGVIRHRGKRDGDDLVLRGCNVTVLDDIAELPGFGAAMRAVDWVVEIDGAIVFPGFFGEHNSDPAEKKKAQNAERQARFRDRQKQESDVTSSVTHNVTVTHREEKSREEKDSITTDSNRERRATRLPADWTPPADWLAWAKQERPDLDLANTAATFADYWRGKPGKDGTKADWLATWRNWVRREKAAPAAAQGKFNPTAYINDPAYKAQWDRNQKGGQHGHVFDGTAHRVA